jgi:hypothetical protein
MQVESTAAVGLRAAAGANGRGITIQNRALTGIIKGEYGRKWEEAGPAPGVRAH